ADGEGRGDSAEERGARDWGCRGVLTIPAAGIDSTGTEVRGYWYAYSGSGSMAPTEKRTTGLIELIRTRLERTGTATMVTNVRDGDYETDGRAYLGLKRDARDIRPGGQRPGPGNAGPASR